jgi:hypothetical protein
MKKLIVSALVLGLLATAAVAPAYAGKRKQRVAKGTYENPAIGIPGVVGTSSAGGAFEFAVGAKESFIDIQITDDGGQSVTATLSQDTDPSTPSWEIFATICGETEEPLTIEPGVAVRVSVYTMPGPEQPTCTGPATSGTIKATFSNLP